MRIKKEIFTSLESRIKFLEEESRVLMQDIVVCEIRFAEYDKKLGATLDEIIEGIRERYSFRLRKFIIPEIVRSYGQEN